MAESSKDRRRDQGAGLDTPRESRRQLLSRPQVDPDAFGRASEKFARFMGTGRFLVYMSAFVALWLIWNTFAPESAQFDPRALNYTLLTLILSLQASYAAPLILLAQNRQDDRDRVLNEQDRSQQERALADTEYLTREVAALRIALREVATRDFVRSELRSILEELQEESEDGTGTPKRKGKGTKKRKDQSGPRRDPARSPADKPTDEPTGPPAAPAPEEPASKAVAGEDSRNSPDVTTPSG